jgi:NitT/TauT family transport system substrate-binding protein
MAGHSMKGRSFFLLIYFLVCLAHPSQQILAAEGQSPRKVRMAFTSLSGSMIPPWMAREAGIFAKHGLEVEVIATPSGVEGMNALIAGEVQFLQIAGGTTVSAALGGADVIILGTTIDTFVQNLMVRPEIEKAEQLKGKSLGISRFGTSIDTGARVALRHFGLVPEKDVAIVQVGSVEATVLAMQGNRVQAGILSFPSIARAKKLGHRVLLDIGALGIPYASTGMTTRGRLVREDPDLIRRYMAAQVEAIARVKRDRNFAMTVMGKYLRTTDSEMLSETYDIYVQKHLLKVPLPSVDALKTVLEELAPRNPKAKEVDPRKFFDDSFVRQMQSSGFIDSLYR